MGINVEKISREDRNKGIKIRDTVQGERDGRRHYHVVQGKKRSS